MRSKNSSLSAEALAILRAIIYLGYLTSSQIATETGIDPRKIAGYLTSLQHSRHLQRVNVPGFKPRYWLRRAGVRAIGQIWVPSIGWVDLTAMTGKQLGTFVRVQVSHPITMPHLTDCTNLAVTLSAGKVSRMIPGRPGGEVVMCEKLVRLIERLTGKRISTLMDVEGHYHAQSGRNGHCADLTRMRRDGTVDTFEIERSCHSSKDNRATQEGIAASGYIATVTILCLDRRAFGTHNILARNLGIEHRVSVLSYKDRLPDKRTLEHVVRGCGRRRRRYDAAAKAQDVVSRRDHS